MWKAAKQFISEADEIWILGYQFHSLDYDSALDLLEGARGKRVVIVNPCAKGIKAKLELQAADRDFLIEAVDQRFENVF